MADLSEILNEVEDTQTATSHWSSLAKMTLARIIIFNKTRSRETATLQLSMSAKLGQLQWSPLGRKR